MRFNKTAKEELKVIITNWFVTKGLLKPGQTRHVELSFWASAEVLKPNPKKEPLRKKFKSS